MSREELVPSGIVNVGISSQQVTVNPHTILDGGKLPPLYDLIFSQGTYKLRQLRPLIGAAVSTINFFLTKGIHFDPVIAYTWANMHNLGTFWFGVKTYLQTAWSWYSAGPRHWQFGLSDVFNFSVKFLGITWAAAKASNLQFPVEVVSFCPQYQVTIDQPSSESYPAQHTETISFLESTHGVLESEGANLSFGTHLVVSGAFFDHLDPNPPPYFG